MHPLHSVIILKALLVLSFQLLPVENWKGTPSEGSESSKCVHDQHKCLILDESTSIIYLIQLRGPQRRVILYSPAKIFLIPSWGQWFAKNSCNLFYINAEKTWRLLSPCFWQPLQLQIKQLMRRKTTPTTVFPNPQPSLRKNAVTNDTFHLSTMPLLRL